MSHELDILGLQFGRLIVVAKTDEINTYPSGQRVRKLLCKCECGKDSLVTSQMLRSGKTRSCGCLQKDEARKSGIATRKKT